MPERWFVISHEATNSGAPRMLLQVLQGVRAARGPEWSCEILLGRGGALQREFERFGPVEVLAHPWAEGASLRAGIMRKFVDRPWLQPRRLARGMKRWGKCRFDLVYNNTAMNGRIVSAARRLSCPIVTHVHELGSVLRRFNTPAALAQTLANTDHFIAVSPAVAVDLTGAGAASERVTVVPNFLPDLPRVPSAKERVVLRESLGLPPEAAIVTGCGHLHPIKGTDLFVEMAALLAARMGQPICCVWLGGETDRRFAGQVRREVRRRKLESVVRFIGAVDDVRPWFAASDAVVVTSREESFSMVALEAAASSRPVVGFIGARGLESILSGIPELLAPGHEAQDMAELLERLLRNPPHAQQIGQTLRAKVAAAFLAGPRVTDILSVVDRLQGKQMS